MWQVCRFDPRWKTLRNTSFLAYCREERQLSGVWSVPCNKASSLSYTWKSFVDSPLDDYVEAYLLKLVRGRPLSHPTVAVFSAGAHHFAMHVNHTNAVQSHIADSWMIPQAWMNVWVNSTMHMMGRLASLRKQGICCLWKTNNIGHRLHEGSWHHPSVEGGLHDYLNQFSVAQAAYHGVPVIDLRQFTVAMTKDVLQKPGALPGMGDQDFYHGYNFPLLWTKTLSRIKEVCQLL
jgi:hypothetical protein